MQIFSQINYLLVKLPRQRKKLQIIPNITWTTAYWQHLQNWSCQNWFIYSWTVRHLIKSLHWNRSETYLELLKSSMMELFAKTFENINLKMLSILENVPSWFFLVGIHSMQGWTVTTWHRVLKKWKR